MRTYKLKINDQDIAVDVKSFNSESASLSLNGKTVDIKVTSVESLGSKVSPRKATASVPAPVVAAPAAPVAGSGAIVAPIPGAIMEIFVKVGDKVTAGQAVLKMEAMKMENEIKSPRAGVVKAVKVSPGSTISQGQELVTLE